MKALFICAKYKVRLVQESVQYLSSNVEPRLFQPVGDTWDQLSTSILNEVELVKPDVVWTDHAYFAGAMPRTVPYVLTLRGDWWTEYSVLPPDALTFFMKTPEYAAHTVGFLYAKRILPLSAGLMKRVKQHYPNLQCTVIPQGIDSQRWQPKPRRGILKHPSIAIIQNHAIRPKADGLLAFAPVIYALPEFHFYVSEGQSSLQPQTYLPRFKDAVNGLGNVTFMDVQTPEAVNELLTETDLYALPSGLDWCPTTALEAGLMQRITVASRIEGITDIIQEDVNGYTARNGNVQEWVDCIRKAQQQKDDGASARKYIVERFDWRVVTPQLERVFREVT